MKIRINQHSKSLLILLATASFPALVSAQDAWSNSAPIVYPAKGQSQDQMSRDRYECSNWANQQAGSSANQSNNGSAAKEGLRGGFRGAAAGAAIGAIAGNAGKGAAIGATGGALKRGINKYDSNKNTASSNFNRAEAACLEARGYSVK